MQSYESIKADEDEKRILYIMLTMIKGIGPKTQNILIDVFTTVEHCFSASADELLKDKITGRIGSGRAGSFMKQRSSSKLRERAEFILEECRQKDIDVITREDERYPDRFHSISDMPVVLYGKGKLRINEYSASIGIVGARRCTQDGKHTAILTAEKAAECHAAVISGMAKGIDSYAHTAAVKTHGYTIAVLGNGPDICYPKEHKKLYESIMETGCILSEYPPGTRPREYYFPQRNRLIAALSDQIYVVEAGRNSGTASTVESGLKYGREVYRT